MSIYQNPQDRTSQPKRAGGNSAEFGIEKHDQAKALRIGIKGVGGVVAGDTGKNSTWGAIRDCGGNKATESSAIEKHNRGKGTTVLDLGRPNSAKDAPSNIRVSVRADDEAGNDAGKVEKETRGSKRVPASRRFKS